ncbi:serine/threonine protein kinase [Pseudonocardia sp. Ae168_Ps1]|nr:serine/threonine protein kinase [Pseudonocardia sp. Ae150A_Ps1]OLL78642.1 serine/threonine protein kinase [Pseudonocardia sp. Ae168_Ps1]OLL92740.1 serine/threonine protein kinase [Pseudonocardia sp. Ae356_Ps1]
MGMDGAFTAGTVFGDFEIRGRLGAGGMGEVFRAFDHRHGGEVALKVLSAHLAGDRVTVERFRREARAAFELRDPHVVPVHGYGESDGRLYLSMRLIDGEDLARLLARRAPLPAARAAGIVRQAAHALDAAHAAGLVHRDVKPANLLVVEARDDFTYLVDFGIARVVGPEPTAPTALTATGATVGTLGYLAPERLRSSDAAVDGRADVYSLTCVLFEMLTGRQPFPGTDPAAVLSAHLVTPPPRVTALRPDLAPGWDEVVARGMAKDPGDRPATAGALAAQVQALVEAAPVAPPPTRPEVPPTLRDDDRDPWIVPGEPDGPPGRDTPPRHGRRVLATVIGAATLVAAVLVAAVWVVVPRGGAEPPVVVPSFETPEPAADPGPLQPAGTTSAPVVPAGDGDLGLDRPVSRLGCSGQDVVVVGAAVDPARYVEDVTMHLDRHRGSDYLLSLRSCSSFRPRTPDGNLIYAVYLGPFPSRDRACTALRAAGGDSYIQPLGAAPRTPGDDVC